MKLYRVHDNAWILLGIEYDCKGTIKALDAQGVSMFEINFSMITMMENDHHVGEFGVNKTFTYSKRIVDAA